MTETLTPEAGAERARCASILRAYIAHFDPQSLDVIDTDLLLADLDEVLRKVEYGAPAL